MKWLAKGVILSPQVGERAARNGHLHVLEWLRANGNSLSFVPNGAASGGHLKILDWTRVHSIPFNASICIDAANQGQLDALKWLKKHGYVKAFALKQR